MCVLTQLRMQGPFPASPASGQENPGEAGLESCNGKALNPVLLAFPHLCSLLLECYRNKGKEREVGGCQGKACCLPGDRGIIQLQ